MLDQTILKSEETVVLELRQLYQLYGYTCFKMSKFEEYDLYSQNKEFLVSDSVIAFTDTDGKLMALKPDVTLSIVKNTVDVPGCVSRLCYDEHVYRISDKTHRFKEITQTGLECIGDLTDYHLYEVLQLAARSLAAISEESVLNVSHLGVISALLNDIPSGTLRTSLLRCIEEKNAHGVREVCAQYGITAERAELMAALTTAYGPYETVLPQLRALTDDPAVRAALDELEGILRLCGQRPGVRICVDLSLVSDMNYYNGLIFRGYVRGIPTGILRGGQYDRLMEKMGKSSRAVGFAVYLDMLERLEKEPEYDVDTLLLCRADTPAADIARRTEELVHEGRSVAVQSIIPDKLRYRIMEELSGKEGV